MRQAAPGQSGCKPGNPFADVGNCSDFPEGRARCRADRKNPPGCGPVAPDQLAVIRHIKADPQVVDPRLPACQKARNQRCRLVFRIAADAATVDDPRGGKRDGQRGADRPEGDLPGSMVVHVRRRGARALHGQPVRLHRLPDHAGRGLTAPAVVPGYPDRILPRDDKAAAILKTRTLTNLYNTRPAWLDHAHKALDQAVADAYGWGDDWRAGRMGDDEILARLFRLNQQRAGVQG